MQLKNNLSYLRKLSLTSVLTTLVSVLLVIVVAGVVSFNYARNEVVEHAKSTAIIIGASTRGAILAGEAEYTNELLKSLSQEENVIDAHIFVPNQGKYFSFYQNPDFPMRDLLYFSSFQGDSQEPVIVDKTIIVSEPIFVGQELIASISLRVTLDILYSRTIFILKISLLCFILALVCSWLMWKFTRPFWAGPFIRFARSLHMISLEKDYSRRVHLNENDEFVGLAKSVNSMLEQIEEHQVQLIRQQIALEAQVKERTQELTLTNTKLLSEIDERAKTEMNLQKLTSAVTQAEESVIITDRKGVIEYVNPSYQRITGQDADRVIGKTVNLMNPSLHKDGFIDEVWDTVRNGKTFKGVFINTRPNGDNYHLEQSITPVFNDSREIINFVATGRDITDRIQSEVALQHMAHHDALTSLPNRTLLMDRIEHAIQRANRENSEVAVMFIDLDGFKVANDMYGHEAGDMVLRTVASRLRTVVRTQDTVARISGDEFVVVLEDMQTPTDVGIVARKLLETLCKPYAVHANEIFCSASIGVAIYPNDGSDTRSLLKHSDQAMYKAKRDGKARYSFYSQNDRNLDTQRMKLEQELIRAVKEKQFVLHYQPLMYVDESAVHGVEALLRWEHSQNGLISPDRFIPYLEDSGMIDEVGAWVLEEACLQLSHWHAEGWEKLIMSVNVSPRQLNDKNFVDYVVNALQISGIDAQYLEVEITERMFLAFNEINLANLNRLSDLGVRIAVDDFGMGHSSLSYISKLKVNTLKIDRSFISEMTHNKEDEKIVSALIGLGERLNINVTAEGVETREQLSILESLNCNFAQGYLFSKAMPPHEFQVWSQSATKQMKILTDEALLDFIDTSY